MVLDRSASEHVPSNVDVVINLMEVHGSTKFKTIGGKFHAIIVISKIVISFKDDVIENNVFYVLGVSNNLLFMESLVDKGFQVLFNAQNVYLQVQTH
jgi:hypothetical protein